MDTSKKLSNFAYIILLATAMLLPLYNLYQLLVMNINPVTTMIIWQVVVAVLFFMEFLGNAMKK